MPQAIWIIFLKFFQNNAKIMIPIYTDRKTSEKVTGKWKNIRWIFGDSMPLCSFCCLSWCLPGNTPPQDLSPGSDRRWREIRNNSKVLLTMVLPSPIPLTKCCSWSMVSSSIVLSYSGSSFLSNLLLQAFMIIPRMPGRQHLEPDQPARHIADRPSPYIAHSPPIHDALRRRIHCVGIPSPYLLHNKNTKKLQIKKCRFQLLYWIFCCNANSGRTA